MQSRASPNVVRHSGEPYFQRAQEDVIAGAEPAVDEALRKPVDASFGPRKVGLRQALQKPLRLGSLCATLIFAARVDANREVTAQLRGKRCQFLDKLPDANMQPKPCEAARLRDFDIDARLDARPQGLEIRSNAPGGELMHLKGSRITMMLSTALRSFLLGVAVGAAAFVSGGPTAPFSWPTLPRRYP